MNIAEITEAEVNSVAELIDLDESFRQQIETDASARRAFRGQSQEYKTLRPSFRRQFTRDSVGAASIIEGRLIEAFRQHYRALKDRNPDMPKPEQIREGFDLRCLSVMQHYEIPTRLLDWTTDFWTAVYFAAASDPGQNAELWHYDRRIFDAQVQREPSLVVLLQPANDIWTPEPPFLGRRR
ncbi:MAG: FRG domain-containing protein, partial [Verrucomicrobiales bacterium]|nr:FRG domain-containing protein [Verrucomicrobiales bacterium]